MEEAAQMTIFELPVLGPTKFKTSKRAYASWDVEVFLNDEPISATFRVDGHEMTAELLGRVEKFFVDIAHYDHLARTAMRDDYARGEGATCHSYLSDHLTHWLHPDDRVRCFGTEGDSSMLFSMRGET
jgi:hypothetical protein